MMELTKSIKKIHIGIDPGTKGGITSFTTYNDGEVHIEVWRLSKLTESEIALVIRCLGTPYNHRDVQIFAVIEKVWAFKGQGVSSTFKFGHSYGFLRGCLVSSNIPLEEKTPQTWMKMYGMKKDKNESGSQWKNRLKGKAQQLFPKINMTLEECDSILIANYCKNEYK